MQVFGKTIALEAEPVELAGAYGIAGLSWSIPCASRGDADADCTFIRVSRPTLRHGLLHHLLDNRRDVRGSAVDRRETGVGLIEDEVKVGAG